MSKWSRRWHLIRLIGQTVKQRLWPSKGGQLQLAQRIGNLHGLPQKIGQILATTEITSADPAYRSLVEHPGQLGISEVHQTLDRLWPLVSAQSRPWRAVLLDLASSGNGASLAQVHRARLPDGIEVAVKIQYPTIGAELGIDLTLLKWLLRPVGVLRKKAHLKAYQHELGQRLCDELDYRLEAAALMSFHHRLVGDPVLRCPRPFPELSHERLLIMTWMPEGSFEEARGWPAEDRVEVGQALLRLFFRGLFSWKVLHADPNPGNYRFFHDSNGAPAVGVIDFGSLYHVSDSEQAAWRDLILAVRQGKLDEHSALEGFVGLGFDRAKLAPMKAQLPTAVKLILKPFAEPAQFTTHSWKLARPLLECLGPHRMAFREAGPPRFLFFIRIFQGLCRYLDGLGVALDWHHAFDEARGVASSRERRPVHRNFTGRTAPAKPGSIGDENQTAVQTLTAAAPGIDQEATLQIEATSAGEAHVSLSFPLATIDMLPDLIPREVRDRMTARGISLPDLISRARDPAHWNTDLLHDKDGAKVIRVWIEARGMANE